MKRSLLDEQCVLYWVHDETCLDPATHGYVGITAHEAARKGVHRRRRPHATFTILFRGTRRECLAIEHQHRPERRVGWNLQRGGGRLRGQLSRSTPSLDDGIR